MTPNKERKKMSNNRPENKQKIKKPMQTEPYKCQAHIQMNRHKQREKQKKKHVLRKIMRCKFENGNTIKQEAIPNQ